MEIISVSKNGVDPFLIHQGDEMIESMVLDADPACVSQDTHSPKHTDEEIYNKELLNIYNNPEKYPDDVAISRRLQDILLCDKHISNMTVKFILEYRNFDLHLFENVLKKAAMDNNPVNKTIFLNYFSFYETHYLVCRIRK